MATALAPVTPAVLRWARESIGVSVDDAAARVQVTPARVSAWEAGDEEPTVAKLRLLAKMYQRPLAVFFLPEPPTTFQPIRDFRRLPGQTDHSWSRALHKVVRRALEQQEVAAEILEEDGEEVSSSVPSASLDEEPELAASAARSALGIDLETQFRWTDPADAVASWIAAMERLGVLVLRTSEVLMAEMRGFSISSGRLPVIVVNALDWPRGQVFTLAHEFAHLMVRESGLCDLLEPDSEAGRRIEIWCNAVSAALLMPAESFLSHELVAQTGERPWDDDSLAHLSHLYSVSREAVLRRLVTLGRATPAFYDVRRAEYVEAYEEHRAAEREKRRRSPGGPPPYRMAIRDRGVPYVQLVLDAYHRDAITSSSLSRLLGLRLKHIPALEREVRGRS